MKKKGKNGFTSPASIKHILCQMDLKTSPLNIWNVKFKAYFYFIFESSLSWSETEVVSKKKKENKPDCDSEFNSMSGLINICGIKAQKKKRNI